MTDLDIQYYYECASATSYKTTELSSCSDKVYTVIFEYIHGAWGPEERWTCDCPSFGYRTGLDKHGHCKHIRRAMKRRCGWLQFTDGGTPATNDNGELVCPDCESPVISHAWGV